MESELSLRGEPLIPGLPDDVALDCLLRLQSRATQPAKLSASGGIYYLVVKSDFSPEERRWASKTLGSLSLPSTSALERLSGRFLTLLTSLGTLSQQCLARIRFVPLDLGVFRFPRRALSLFVGVWFLM
jgi:hypothetical protein